MAKTLSSFDPKQHRFFSPKFRSVVDDAAKFFDMTPRIKLPPPSRFQGSGVYALYYSGDFSHYQALSDLFADGSEIPIYVGKAVPPGWRTARSTALGSPDLFRRLNEHAKSIQQTSNLKIEHFTCRFIILAEQEGDLVVPLEAKLIRLYKPLWNNAVDGFGNHDPGSGRDNQAKSEWDVLHKGRNWATRLKGSSPKKSKIIAKVKRVLKASGEQLLIHKDDD
jgi:Eco29kI restriction endonuclease.